MVERSDERIEYWVRMQKKDGREGGQEEERNWVLGCGVVEGSVPVSLGLVWCFKDRSLACREWTTCDEDCLPIQSSEMVKIWVAPAACN